MAKSLKERLQEQLSKNMEAHTASQQDTVFDAGSKFVKIHLDKIDPNPYQPRIHFDEKEINELAESIQASGLLQPISVRQLGERYQIIAGERRFRAHQRLGQRSIEAIVKELSDGEMAAQALAENIARQDLSDFEISKSIKHLLETYPTKTQLASAIGIPRPDLYSFLAFDDLPAFVLERLTTSPRLISRTLAKEIKQLLNEKGGNDDIMEGLRRALEKLDNKEINSNQVIDFVQRSILGRETARAALEPFHLVRSGKRVGSISKDQRNLIVRFKRTALTEDQEQRLTEFLQSLASEQV